MEHVFLITVMIISTSLAPSHTSPSSQSSSLTSAPLSLGKQRSIQKKVHHPLPSTVVSPPVAASPLAPDLDGTLDQDLQLHQHLLDAGVLPVQVGGDLRQDPGPVPQLGDVGHNLPPRPLGHPLHLQLLLGQADHLLIAEAHHQLSVLVEPQQLQPGRHQLHARGLDLIAVK